MNKIVLLGLMALIWLLVYEIPNRLLDYYEKKKKLKEIKNE